MLAPLLLEESRDATRQELRHPRRGARHRRARRARLRDHAGATTTAGARSRRSASSPPRPCCSRAFLVWEARTRRAADAVLDLPPAHARRRERRRADPRHGAVRDVPRCSRSTCSRCSATRRCGPASAYLAVAGTAIVWSAVAAQLVNRVGVKPVLVAGMAFLTAGLALLHAGVGRRLVPRRPAARLPADRDRHGLLVRADLDRGARGRAAVRGGSRLGADQHVAADRRRARDRGAVGGRDLDDGRRARVRDARCPSRSPTASRPRSSAARPSPSSASSSRSSSCAARTSSRRASRRFRRSRRRSAYLRGRRRTAAAPLGLVRRAEARRRRAAAALRSRLQ